jgi:hypothetical protein
VPVLPKKTVESSNGFSWTFACTGNFLSSRTVHHRADNILLHRDSDTACAAVLGPMLKKHNVDHAFEAY